MPRPEAHAHAADADAAGAALLASAAPAFARRLEAASPAPLAVGFSGGGDSLGLLLAARAWAAAAGRPVLALTVDHRVNPASVAWTDQAGEVAARLGVGFQALRWGGEKPRAGLQAAARRARHVLLAEAAREAGASVLLLGHTLDDRLEAEWMRARGASVGDPREWAPSPVWPEGRGVFLLRPLLELRRAEIRTLVRPSGLSWIEDPANLDGRFLRSLARGAAPNAPPLPRGETTGAAFEVDAAGTIRLDRAAAPRLVAMACVCVGGGDRLPRSDAALRLGRRLAAGERFTATLAGARLEAGDALLIERDPGRLPITRAELVADLPMVWDGRFEILARKPGLSVRPLGGLMSHLEKRSCGALGAFSPVTRRTLPAVVEPDGTVTCPILAQSAWSAARTLVDGRLRAACGGIAREPNPAAGSHGERGPGALS